MNLQSLNDAITRAIQLLQVGSHNESVQLLIDSFSSCKRPAPGFVDKLSTAEVQPDSYVYRAVALTPFLKGLSSDAYVDIFTKPFVYQRQQDAAPGQRTRCDRVSASIYYNIALVHHISAVRSNNTKHFLTAEHFYRTCLNTLVMRSDDAYRMDTLSLVTMACVANLSHINREMCNLEALNQCRSLLQNLFEVTDFESILDAQSSLEFKAFVYLKLNLSSWEIASAPAA